MTMLSRNVVLASLCHDVVWPRRPCSYMIVPMLLWHIVVLRCREMFMPHVVTKPIDCLVVQWQGVVNQVSCYWLNGPSDLSLLSPRGSQTGTSMGQQWRPFGLGHLHWPMEVSILGVSVVFRSSLNCYFGYFFCLSCSLLVVVILPIGGSLLILVSLSISGSLHVMVTLPISGLLLIMATLHFIGFLVHCGHPIHRWFIMVTLPIVCFIANCGHPTHLWFITHRGHPIR